MAKTLSLRTLNRTLLRRQFLLERTTRPAAEVIRQLIAVQAQEPNWPYVGLWARMREFHRDELTELIEKREVVRSTMVRRTQHLAAAQDFCWLRPSVEPIVAAALRDRYYAEHIVGIDLPELAEVGRELLSNGALSRKKLGQLLASRYPGRNATRLANTVELLLPLVHPMPAAAWGRWGHPRAVSVAMAQDFTGMPMADAPQLKTLVLRYLAAFGPASVKDAQAWAGITKLREVFDVLRSQLRVFRSEQGVELFDVPDAPITDAELPAPVRFLPAYDNVLQGHHDRTRIISEQDRKRTAREASGGVPMFLVDGVVRGRWSWKDSMLRIEMYRELSSDQWAQLEAEARNLATFLVGSDDVNKLSISFVN
ncbi:MAG: winged helix DNA-binding domain-containing protein [Corynebacteriales bacterium]|nr:winged helix DNA-binding domain-containing protein [Mycobacteriales bacterium]